MVFSRLQVSKLRFRIPPWNPSNFPVKENASPFAGEVWERSSWSQYNDIDMCGQGDVEIIAADINIWWAEIRTSFPLVFFSRVSVKQALIQVKQALKRFKWNRPWFPPTSLDYLQLWDFHHRLYPRRLFHSRAHGHTGKLLVWDSYFFTRLESQIQPDILFHKGQPKSIEFGWMKTDNS